MSQDSDLTLVIDYSGRLESQGLDIDNVQPDSAPAPALFTEPRYLLSNRSYWYPQNPIPDYATATLRITVPDDFSCVASGEPAPEENAAAANSRTFAFRANQPLRYLALVVSRMNKAAERRLELAEPGAERSQPLLLTIEANPRLQGRGRALAAPAEEILRYYASLVGEAPYTAATVALIENEVPGGHSPGYFALLHEPQTLAALSWRRDPASFDGYPEFFLAHELAHQWWGQAVSWKNYHEQWLSEGFAQYFAALYAQKTRGERVYTDMLRQFRRWALDQSDQGPVYLGYRLGHIKGEPRVFRALVYNKGAGVLHMLRRLVGDDAFFQGLRLFYQDRRYQKAGTEDLERAMEQASGRTLDHFFETWIYGAEMPRVSYRTAIVDGSITVTFEQTGKTVFDLPVTVRVISASGQAIDVVVAVTDKQVVRTIPTDGTAREIQINPDFAALAEFQER